MCVALCTLLCLFIQLVLTPQVWQTLTVKCQSFYEHIHTSIEMTKRIWLISLLICNIVRSGQRQGPCLSKCYKGQHCPTLFLFIIKINNGYKAKKMLSFIASVSVSQKHLVSEMLQVTSEIILSIFNTEVTMSFQIIHSSWNCDSY